MINSSYVYKFGSMIDASDINVTEEYNIGDNKTGNNIFVLNLKTGFVHNIERNGSAPFIFVLPTPITYNMSSGAVSHEQKEFNGFDRSALIATSVGINESSNMEYDAETGILLNAHSVGKTKVFGKYISIEFSNNLVDTNMISSDSNSTDKSATIPAWVKNMANWWAKGSINDSEFVKSVQYLISSGVIHIPHGVTANQTDSKIPSWIKRNAGWWAGGKISDDEFLTGIQYLINKGIIKV